MISKTNKKLRMFLLKEQKTSRLFETVPNMEIKEGTADQQQMNQ